jgi:hypothetical protein
MQQAHPNLTESFHFQAAQAALYWKKSMLESVTSTALSLGFTSTNISWKLVQFLRQSH